MEIMEESNNPRPNEFVISEDEAYAMTNIGTWESIEFLMTRLEPVKIEDLGPNDRQCAICRMEYCDSEDVDKSHSPVKTVCGHVFGKGCIMWWLDPLSYWGSADGADPEIYHGGAEFEHSKTICPLCRRIFYREASREPMERLAARLWFWDHCYAFAGVARSEKEERSRKQLWQFVEYCRSKTEFQIDNDTKFFLLLLAQYSLADFAKWLKTEALTPIQERLRETLERLGDYDLSDIVHDLEDGSDFPYVFDPVPYVSDPESYVSQPVSEDEEDEEDEENHQPDHHNPEGS